MESVCDVFRGKTGEVVTSLFFVPKLTEGLRRSPNLNIHCERFVRSIKEEALAQMVMLGERALYHVIYEYLVHYHTERNHQGLDNQLITPERAVGCQTGHVRRRERLGGLLSYYYREAA